MPTTFANTIDGNDIFAKRAECDAAGNDLSTTYATKSELPDGVPAVTSSDNNKTLVSTYNNDVGTYAWAQNTFVAVYGSSTYAEIKAAIDAGYNVLCLKTDPSYESSSFAGGIAYMYRYGLSGGNIEFNYFQAYPNKSQATASNQGISVIHIWKVDRYNVWTASTVVVAPKIVANSPLSLSYSNVNREVTLGVSLGSTLTTANNAIEVAAPIPDVTSVDDGKVLKASYSGGTGSYSWQTESGGGGGGSYSAGTGIDITNDVISVDTTTVAMKTDIPSVPVTDVTVDGVSVVSSGTAAITMPTIPVTDVEVGGSSVVNAQGVAEITMPTVPVQDVTVDGASVLNAQGVAEITMPTFTQAQADWTESDTSDPSYIQNKPTLAAVATSGSYSDLSGTPTINNVPAVTSSDDSKVLKASYSGGVGSYSWETESGGGDGADWAAEQGEPGYIENKPVPKTLTGGTGISITESPSTITVSCNVTAPVQDVTVDGTSVVSNGVAAITSPTVDQTYDASSVNAQSGVAVASGISDAIAALPSNLSSAQIQALKEALGVDETVLFEDSSGIGTGTQLVLSEAYTNFEKLQFMYKTWTDDTVDVNTFGSNASIFTLTSGWTSSSLYALFLTTYTATDTTHLSVTKCGFNNVTGGAWTTTNANYRLYKVVGIHRIASN